MKWIAIVLNVLLLATLTYFLATEPGPGPEGTFMLFVALLFAAPISSLVALFFYRGDGWIGLYLQRKALEEKKKIERLSGSST